MHHCDFFFFSSAIHTLLNDRLQEKKAQNFQYKKSWVKLMLFGFSDKNTLPNLKWLFVQKWLFWPEMAF
jgi:hypothetical protein